MGLTDGQLGYLLKRAQNGVRTALEREMTDGNLTMSRYAALAALDEHDELSNAELARRCFVSPQTMVRIIKDLERDGYVTRRPNPRSNREVLSELTSAGQQLLNEGHAASAAVHEQLLAGFTKSDVEAAARLLSRLADNMESRS